MIEGIKELAAKLQALALANHERLEDRQIPLVHAGVLQRVAAQVPEFAGTRTCESIAIEPLLNGFGSLGIRNYIRPLILRRTDLRDIRAHHYIERPAGPQADNSGELPSPEEGRAYWCRQGKDEVAGEDVRAIEVRNTSLGSGVALGWRHVPGITIARPIVDGFRPGVGESPREPFGEPHAVADL